jgi:hypothetical protein
MNTMAAKETLLGAEENSVLQKLKNSPVGFVNEVETDGLGRYRICSGSPKDRFKRKFLAPQVRFILEHGGRPLDLSSFT